MSKNRVKPQIAVSPQAHKYVRELSEALLDEGGFPQKIGAIASKAITEFYERHRQSTSAVPVPTQPPFAWQGE
jgi:hypothetical protein